MKGIDFFPGDPREAEIFDRLAEELATEEISPQQGILLADIVRGEALKEKLAADIWDKGVASTVYNGRQSFRKENKSLSTLLKLQDQQRRTMQTLGLIGKSAETSDPAVQDEDDFDEF